MGEGLRVTYVGGPTALLEFGGLRLLTDPTFDPGGSEYRTAVYGLHKLAGPALTRETLGAVDVVLLSHDHHFDNLDRAGRAMLASAGTVITTSAGAGRLAGTNAVGLSPWQSHTVESGDGRVLEVTATPARHGPPDGDRGPVIGFILRYADRPERVVYVSGDTVWYDGIADIGQRFKPGVAVLFMGAARVPEVGPANLTFTADEAVRATRALGTPLVVPLHFEDWGHFSESRPEIERAFAAARLDDRLRWPARGRALELWP